LPAEVQGGTSEEERLIAGPGRRSAAGTIAAAAALAGLAASPASAGAAKPAVDCQPYRSTPCLLPFPNDSFTRPDSSSATGLRVDLPQNAMPENAAGKRINVGPYDRADGFDPGSTIIARVPGLDNQQAFAKTDPVKLNNLSRYKGEHTPIVVIDARTGKRALIWVELDSTAADPESTTLLIHPAKLLTEGDRYIVALRHLKDSGGDVIPAPRWFKVFKDDRRHQHGQRARYRSIFKSLKEAGIGRRSLYAAWDFTVESRGSLSRSMVHIRDDAFAQLGDTNLGDGQVQGHAPSFQVREVTTNPFAGIAREISGTFQVPCYLKTANCAQGGSFNYDRSGPTSLPEQAPGNTATAPFDCIIPSAATASTPARASLYGHGLLGSDTEVHAGNVRAMAIEHDFVFCATEWWGLAGDDSGRPGTEDDIPHDAGVLQNLTTFPSVGDRLQQADLNTLYLGRLMRTADGFAASPAFEDGGGTPLFDPAHLYYDGNSQGGIMGGMTIALEPDLTRGVIGVPGLDYGGILLQRSDDFVGTFDTVIKASYPDASEYTPILDIVEQLWSRGEAEAYAENMTASPLPHTPAHKVLIQSAYGDHQVSQYAAAVEARTIGAHGHEPALDPVRSQDKNLFYGIPPLPSSPFDGSGWVIWDDGPGLVSPPPLGNLAPPEGGPASHDPHEDVRATVAARAQKSAFLDDSGGAIVDVCGGAPCHTDVYTP
jgi:hypothetical protein